MIRRPLGLFVILAAMAAALLPVPAWWIERWYSEGVYSRLQRSVTAASNAIDWSLFDLVCLLGVTAGLFAIVRSVQRAGWIRGSARAIWRVAMLGSIVYLTFLAMWGLNYRRVPLADKLAFDRARVTAAATADLAMRAANELNRLHDAAHHVPPDDRNLVAPFHDAQRALGSQWAIVTGTPKRTLLGSYFRRAAIAGMTDPFLLEVMLAPDLLDVERPFVLSHEWGHLAGYADESEANFIAWLACARGNERAQYSGWLALFGHSAGALAPAQRRAAFGALEAGPREDLAAIAARYEATSRIVRVAARETYDRYLKANRVTEGIESYDAVLQLILGTAFDANWTPRLR
ncbi:MAG: hypothetical protein DMF84_18290 [Acidobacteria bacterium]|nr:MAG: hypothetical protein DMF84_18290 [Acidobacteriota bacterium]